MMPYLQLRTPASSREPLGQYEVCEARPCAGADAEIPFDDLAARPDTKLHVVVVFDNGHECSRDASVPAFLGDLYEGRRFWRVAHITDIVRIKEYVSHLKKESTMIRVKRDAKGPLNDIQLVSTRKMASDWHFLPAC
jgi:hypothetical protein